MGLPETSMNDHHFIQLILLLLLLSLLWIYDRFAEVRLSVVLGFYWV